MLRIRHKLTVKFVFYLTPTSERIIEMAELSVTRILYTIDRLELKIRYISENGPGAKLWTSGERAVWKRYSLAQFQ